MKHKITLKFIIVLFFITIIFFILNTNVQAAGIDGTTIVINPGHGDTYTGCANGEKKLVEKDLTLKIGNYLRDILKQYYNVNVIMTHDGVNFPGVDAGDLAARAMIARNNNADLYVSLHIDDMVDHSREGATVYVTSRTELPKYKEGMTNLGNKILANLNKLGIKSNGVVNNKLCNDHVPKYQYYDKSQGDYYADIRHCMKGDSEDYGDDFSDGSGVPAVLIEHCYINNSHDVQFLDSEKDLKNLAKADANAIIDYFQLKLTKDVESKDDTGKLNIDFSKGEVKGNKGSKSSLINTSIYLEPSATVSTLQKSYTKATIKNADEKNVKSGNIGTGYKVKIDDKTYTAIKLGDVTGDGTLDSADFLRMKKVLLGIKKVEGIYKESIDLTNDGVVDSADFLRMRKYLLNLKDITF